MEDAFRAWQQQGSALQNQRAAIDTQLRSLLTIAQGLQELPGAITTVMNCAQAPTRRMLVDRKGLGKRPVFSDKEEDLYVCCKRGENYVSGVFPNVRGALSLAQWSHGDVVSAAVAPGVLELHDETSAEIDGEPFTVLSALTRQ